MSATITKKPLTTQSFTLVFAGEFDDLTPEMLDSLYEAGCKDGHVSLCECVLRITFDRSAPSFRVALLSAIADVEKSGLGLELARVEPE